ncbi:hypothetical protein [Leptospira interrogans]|uniref:hypothetical protein n=1 Tax=Leptospira interrogans TaxID=173 RepID=UPI001F0ECFB2|nr:hypothetical protein [Leptospira interrogans]UMQ59095.1 hypothetical protein FH585_04820 [Leptospira interrogans]
MSFLRGQLCEVATHGFAVADLDSSMDRGLSPKRAINLPPAFLTPSIQEYHIRNCLTFKKHTNLWIAVLGSKRHIFQVFRQE